MTSGYSGTPLAKKLGLKPGLRSWRDGMPGSVAAEIGDTGIIPLAAPEAPVDAAHIFVTSYDDMAAKLAMLRPLLAPNGFIWVSWPKRASKVPTDITEDRIRDACRVDRAPGTILDCRGQSNPKRLPATDLVDVKVCAVDGVWSGLKLVIRKSRR